MESVSGVLRNEKKHENANKHSRGAGNELTAAKQWRAPTQSTDQHRKISAELGTLLSSTTQLSYI